MILAANPDKWTKASQIIRECPELVFITGSQYFGTAMPGSDVDLFTSDTPEVKAKLTELGLFKIPNPQYIVGSTDTTEVWGFYGEYESGQPIEPTDYHFVTAYIHVQLCKHPMVHLVIQNKFRENGLARVLKDKNVSRALWKVAVEMYELGELSQEEKVYNWADSGGS